jgi:hypothetical protein
MKVRDLLQMLEGLPPDTEIMLKVYDETGCDECECDFDGGLVESEIALVEYDQKNDIAFIVEAD